MMKNLHWIVVWFVLGIYLPREFDLPQAVTVLLNVISMIVLFYKV